MNCKKVLFFKRSQVKTVSLKNKLSRIFWFLKRSSAATFSEKKLFDIFWRKVKNAFVFFLMQHIFVPLVVNLSFEAQPSFFLTKILGMQAPTHLILNHNLGPSGEKCQTLPGTITGIARGRATKIEITQGCCVAQRLLTQQPQDQFSAFPKKFIVMLLIFIDGTASRSEDRGLVMSI